MKLKFLAVLLFAFQFVFSGSVQAAETGSVKIYINGGKEIVYKNQPHIKDDVVYVPLREAVEEEGGKVNYEAPSAVVEHGYRKLKLTPEEIKVIINEDTEASLKHKIEMINGNMYIALDDIDMIFTINRNEILIEKEGDNTNVFFRFSPVEDKQNKTHDYSFALKLLEQLPENKNTVISPEGLKIGLSMLAAGSDGETKEEILNAIGVSDLDEYMKNLKKQYEEPKYKTATWAAANSIWVNETFLPQGSDFWKNEYKKIIESNFNGDVGTVNGENDVNAINEWALNKTNGLVDSLLSDTKFDFMLMNAVYFEASWKKPFDERDTDIGTFYNKDNSKSDIDFMWHQGWDTPYYEEEGLKAIRMDYGYDTHYVDENAERDLPYDMTFIITDKQLDNNTLNRMYKYFDFPEARIELPKFEIKNEIDFIEILKKIGIENIFNAASADFSGITDEVGFAVDKIFQNAFIMIDEKGTAASAASYLSITRGIADENPVEFIADKPFYFFVRNCETGDILFEGQFVTAK